MGGKSMLQMLRHTRYDHSFVQMGYVGRCPHDARFRDKAYTMYAILKRFSIYISLSLQLCVPQGIAGSHDVVVRAKYEELSTGTCR
jgi:hypothetical protein